MSPHSKKVVAERLKQVRPGSLSNSIAPWMLADEILRQQVRLQAMTVGTPRHQRVEILSCNSAGMPRAVIDDLHHHRQAVTALTSVT